MITRFVIPLIFFLLLAKWAAQPAFGATTAFLVSERPAGGTNKFCFYEDLQGNRYVKTVKDYMPCAETLWLGD